jgi:hypothetical protein
VSPAIDPIAAGEATVYATVRDMRRGDEELAFCDALFKICS